MKKYTFQSIQKLPTLAKEPSPFPGEYPTRIAYEQSWYDTAAGKRVHVRYIGKPTPSACNHWSRIQAAARKRIAFQSRGWEFDRGSCFYSRSPLQGGHRNDFVWAAYFPSLMPESAIGLHQHRHEDFPLHTAGGFRYYNYMGRSVNAETHRLWLNKTFGWNLLGPPKPKIDPLDKPDIYRRMVQRKLVKKRIPGLA